MAEWRHTVWPQGKFVYTAIAKVANTSIKHALLSSFVPGVKLKSPHLPSVPYQAVNPARIGKLYPDYLYIAFVRNPFDRLVSFWADKVEGNDLNDRLKRMGFEAGMPFPAAARIACAIPNERTDPHIRSQTTPLVGRDGALRPDLVLRFERLVDDWDLVRHVVAERTGAALKPLPRRRVSEHRHFSTYYDAETTELVTARYRRDIEILGYPADPAAPAVAGDPDVDARLDELLAERPGASVLDLTEPTTGRAERVESNGGRYLGLASRSAVGQLVHRAAIRDGRVPAGLFAIVIVRRVDAGLGGFCRGLVKLVESAGAAVMRVE